jgi:hypothetical protein
MKARCCGNERHRFRPSPAVTGNSPRYLRPRTRAGLKRAPRKQLREEAPVISITTMIVLELASISMPWRQAFTSHTMYVFLTTTTLDNSDHLTHQ